MMYKSQFKKKDPYDWFCGPGSHLVSLPSADIYLKPLYTMHSKSFDELIDFNAPYNVFMISWIIVTSVIIFNNS